MTFPAFTSGSKLSENSAVGVVARAFNALVTNLQQIFTYLLARVQLDSVLLTGVVLVDGQTTVPHTLGRTLTGWIVIRVNAAAVIWETPSPDPATYLVLNSTGPCTVSLEVF